MKSTMKKTAMIVAGMLTLVLVSGNVLMAEENKAGGLLPAGDLAFIGTGFQPEGTMPAGEITAPPSDLITAADLALVVRPYIVSTGVLRPQETAARVGIITAADYRFLTGGQAAAIFTVFGDLADSLATRIGQ